MISMKKLVLASIAASALLVSHAMAGDQVDQHFSKMDTNKDGKISAAEYAAAAKARFEKMDTNKDGKFTSDDTKARHMARGQAAAIADMAADMLKTADTNGDGIVTAEEHAKASQAMFEKMDTDKDGFLSKQELAAGRAAMMKQWSK